MTYKHKKRINISVRTTLNLDNEIMEKASSGLEDMLLFSICCSIYTIFKFYKEVNMTLKEKVESALEKVRPSLQADGGDVQLIDVDDDGVVKVTLQGACAGCPMSQMTLKMGIEKILKQNVPEVTGVVSV